MLMSDRIDELCATCKCKKENCRKIEEKSKGNCKIYKCLNYEKDQEKICPYKKFPYCIRSNNEKMKNKKLNKS